MRGTFLPQTRGRSQETALAAPLASSWSSLSGRALTQWLGILEDARCALGRSPPAGDGSLMDADADSGFSLPDSTVAECGGLVERAKWNVPLPARVHACQPSWLTPPSTLRVPVLPPLPVLSQWRPHRADSPTGVPV